MQTKEVPVVCLCGECDNDTKVAAVLPEGCRVWCNLGEGHDGSCGYFIDGTLKNNYAGAH